MDTLFSFRVGQDEHSRRNTVDVLFDGKVLATLIAKTADYAGCEDAVDAAQLIGSALQNCLPRLPKNPDERKKSPFWYLDFTHPEFFQKESSDEKSGA